MQYPASLDEVIRNNIPQLYVLSGTDRDKVILERVYDLFARIVRHYKAIPTAGEVLTFLARRRNELDKLHEQLDLINNQASHQVWYDTFQRFITDDLLSALTPDDRTIVLDLKQVPLDSYPKDLSDHNLHPLQRMSDVFVKVGDVFNYPELVETWRWAVVNARQTSPAARIEACERFLGQTEMHPQDRKLLKETLQRTAGTGIAYGYTAFFNEAAAAIQQLSERLGVRLEKLSVVGAPTYVTFPQAALLLRDNPDATIQTPEEIKLVQHGIQHLQRMMTEEETPDRPHARAAHLFGGEGLTRICSDNPFVREAAFRSALDLLGIDPWQDAAFVTHRRVRFGGVTKPGYYFVYATRPDRNYTVAVLVSCMNEPAPLIWTHPGTVEDMKGYIHDNAPVCTEEFLKKKPDNSVQYREPPTGKNPFKMSNFRFDRIEEHVVLRQAIAARVQAL